MAGGVIWVTGLQGSGKSTLADALIKDIKFLNINPIKLDGDEIRDVLQNQDYSPEGRNKLAFSYARMAHLLASQGHIVVVATVSMFHDVRNWSRENNKNYLEVFLNVPIQTLEARNKKNLFSQNKIEMQDYELPYNPDFELDDSDKAFSMAIETALHKIKQWVAPQT